jgi:NDP-sugar pyrophosphorylase family protein
LKKNLKMPFFVMNGDLLTNLDFEKMLDFIMSITILKLQCVLEEYNIKSPMVK